MSNLAKPLHCFSRRWRQSVSTSAFSCLSNQASPIADVLVVGSGISGTLAATILGQAGLDVYLIDRHAVYPPDFRAEHLDGAQIEQMRRLGFLNGLTAGLNRGETVALARCGRTVGTAATVNYGLRYETLVNRARGNLPANVHTITDRVFAIDPGDDLQHVQMSDGRVIRGRLVVLATGQGHLLCQQAGIRRHMIRQAHSLTFGVDIEPVDQAPFKHSFLVYQGERIQDRIDYLAAFTLDTTTRANLFTYRDYREPWTKAFIKDPTAGLAQVLPGLAKAAGRYRTKGPVVARPMDLYTSKGHKRSGVVLIGDAFQSSCPATGMGMVRLLTDIERLCTVHVPSWVETPGMGADKIAQFYDDPIKRACDAKALHDAEYRRSVSTETTLRWQTHRLRVRAMEYFDAWRCGLRSSSNPRIAESYAEPLLARNQADEQSRWIGAPAVSDQIAGSTT